MKLYHIYNYQHQSVKVVETLDEAKKYIANLKEAFNEKFYVVEMMVVYSL